MSHDRRIAAYLAVAIIVSVGLSVATSNWLIALGVGMFAAVTFGVASGVRRADARTTQSEEGSAAGAECEECGHLNSRHAHEVAHLTNSIDAVCKVEGCNCRHVLVDHLPPAT